MAVEKNVFPKRGSLSGRLWNLACTLFGHRWSYKNYELTLSEDGGQYPYRYSRRCHRCNQRQVFRSDDTGWEYSSENPDATL